MRSVLLIAQPQLRLEMGDLVAELDGEGLAPHLRQISDQRQASLQLCDCRCVLLRLGGLLRDLVLERLELRRLLGSLRQHGGLRARDFIGGCVGRRRKSDRAGSRLQSRPQRRDPRTSSRARKRSCPTRLRSAVVIVRSIWTRTCPAVT